MNCNFVKNEDGLWQCSNPACRWVVPAKLNFSQPPLCSCPVKVILKSKAKRTAAIEQQKKQAAKEAESLRPEGEKLGWTFAMVKRYAKALTRWVAAGRPTRSDEEVAAIETICKPCDKYEPQEGRCSMCGCKILTPGIAILSKASLGTENCPEGKW